MEKLQNFTIPIKIILLQLIIFISLFSCGNRHQENESKEGIADKNTMGEGMMEGEGMMGDGGMMSDGTNEEMRKAMMSEGMGPEMMEDMMAIRKLLMQHKKLNRRVENLENGVKTWTTSEDPEIAAAIQKHVRQMKARTEEHQPIRQMDPLFRELFENADKIEIEIKDLENGIMVVETSKDREVVKLIKQHAHKAVSEFVEQGMQRAMQPTPLPKDYKE